MNEQRPVEFARELNAIVQNYLYEKFGDGSEYQVQYNDDHVHIWFKLPEVQSPLEKE